MIKMEIIEKIDVILRALSVLTQESDAEARQRLTSQLVMLILML